MNKVQHSPVKPMTVAPKQAGPAPSAAQAEAARVLNPYLPEVLGSIVAGYLAPGLADLRDRVLAMKPGEPAQDQASFGRFAASLDKFIEQETPKHLNEMLAACPSRLRGSLALVLAHNWKDEWASSIDAIDDLIAICAARKDDAPLYEARYGNVVAKAVGSANPALLARLIHAAPVADRLEVAQHVLSKLIQAHISIGGYESEDCVRAVVSQMVTLPYSMPRQGENAAVLANLAIRVCASAGDDGAVPMTAATQRFLDDAIEKWQRDGRNAFASESKGVPIGPEGP